MTIAISEATTTTAEVVNCPNCGAPMYESKLGYLICDHCGSQARSGRKAAVPTKKRNIGFIAERDLAEMLIRGIWTVTAVIVVILLGYVTYNWYQMHTHPRSSDIPIPDSDLRPSFQSDKYFITSLYQYTLTHRSRMLESKYIKYWNSKILLSRCECQMSHLKICYRAPHGRLEDYYRMEHKLKIVNTKTG